MEKIDPLLIDTTPKTANLLACKQWWKVCFIKGDQEKYYRQIYGRAAAERMARFHRENDSLSPNQSRIIFPTKLHPPIMLDRYSGNSFRLDNCNGAAMNNSNECNLNQISALTAKSVVNIFDDPFLFGINNDRNENGSDSGIDATFSFKRRSHRDLTRLGLDEPLSNVSGSHGLQSSSPAPPIPLKPNRNNNKNENLLSSPKLAHASSFQPSTHNIEIQQMKDNTVEDSMCKFESDQHSKSTAPLDSSFGTSLDLCKQIDDDTYSALENFTWSPPGLSYDHVRENENVKQCHAQLSAQLCQRESN